LKTFLEPWVLERLLSSDPLVRVVDEYSPEKVKKLPVEVIDWWNGFLPES